MVRGLATRAFLQTRGTPRASDYTFLGAAPEEPWWRAYRDATAFDHPTVLVTSDGEVWAAYLSGIPSARVDAVGTTVRYTLVLDGPCGAAEIDSVRAGVAAWCADVAAARHRGRLSAALDDVFPEDLVDRMITRPFPGGAPDGTQHYCTDASQVHGHVVAALAALPVPPPAAGEPGDWLGGVGAPACRAAFVSRVGLLLAGEPGRALLLNLVGGPDDAAPLRGGGGSLAVLVESADPARPTALRPVVDPKKAPAPPTGAATAEPPTAEPAAPSRTQTATVLAVMAFVVLLGTVVAIVTLLL